MASRHTTPPSAPLPPSSVHRYRGTVLVDAHAVGLANLERHVGPLLEDRMELVERPPVERRLRGCQRSSRARGSGVTRRRRRCDRRDRGAATELTGGRKHAPDALTDWRVRGGETERTGPEQRRARRDARQLETQLDSRPAPGGRSAAGLRRRTTTCPHRRARRSRRGRVPAPCTWRAARRGARAASSASRTRAA